ncbi:helix-turn-helix domain-containing protein [Microbulbifer elongatus]|uniref:helix-turn-helix domain-containing protein n=1 Tax=Microbulbifer elongatus TaxID=86173 RepID=UPI001E2C3B6F|nr:helix-turn-helix transcriptional regulator [Microbulbifer elongatus]
MSEPIKATAHVQIINGADGKPEYAVIPYQEFLHLYSQQEQLIPNAVVGKVIEQGLSPMRAWREYLKLTQAEVAETLRITQAAYAQLESSERPRKSTLQRVASALGISTEQLNI